MMLKYIHLFIVLCISVSIAASDNNQLAKRLHEDSSQSVNKDEFSILSVQSNKCVHLKKTELNAQAVGDVTEKNEAYYVYAILNNKKMSKKLNRFLPEDHASRSVLSSISEDSVISEGSVVEVLSMLSVLHIENKK